MEKENVDKAKEFANQLREEYGKLRDKIDKNLTNEQLIENASFQKCMIIANVLAGAASSHAGFEAFHALGSDVEFDIEKFLDIWKVVSKKDDKGNLIPEVLPKEE